MSESCGNPCYEQRSGKKLAVSLECLSFFSEGLMQIQQGSLPGARCVVNLLAKQAVELKEESGVEPPDSAKL